MHSIASVRSSSGAADYFANDNYYSADEHAEAGVWGGEGARADPGRAGRCGVPGQQGAVEVGGDQHGGILVESLRSALTVGGTNGTTRRCIPASRALCPATWDKRHERGFAAVGTQLDGVLTGA